MTARTIRSTNLNVVIKQRLLLELKPVTAYVNNTVVVLVNLAPKMFNVGNCGLQL